MYKRASLVALIRLVEMYTKTSFNLNATDLDSARCLTELGYVNFPTQAKTSCQKLFLRESQSRNHGQNA
jgi:hypothetical protein